MLGELTRRWFAIPLTVRWAGFLWFVLLVGVTSRVWLSAPTSQTVVPIYLGGAERWLAGEPLYSYEPIAGDVYRNPPGVAVAFTVLTPLPEKLAGVLWRLGSAAMFLFAVLKFGRAIAPNWSTNQRAWMLGLSVILALPAVNNGQVNLLIAASVLGGTAAMLERRWWLAATWFALGGWLKVYPLAVGLLAGLVEPRRLLPRLLLVTVVGFLLPFLLHDPGYVLDQYRDFVTTQSADDRSEAASTRVPRDWTVVPRSWFGWVSPPTVTKSFSLLAAFGCATTILGLRRQPGAVPRALILGLMWMTVFGPATEAHTYVVLAGLAPWLVVTAWPRLGVVCVLIITGYTLLALTVMRAMFPNDWKLTLLGPQAIGTVLLAVGGWFTVRPAPETPATTTNLWSGRLHLSTTRLWKRFKSRSPVRSNTRVE